MAEKVEAENGGWERTAKDLMAGAAGGIAQVLLGELATIAIMSTSTVQVFCSFKLAVHPLLLTYPSWSKRHSCHNITIVLFISSPISSSGNSSSSLDFLSHLLSAQLITLLIYLKANPLVK
jgi:hypothetical protein